MSTLASTPDARTKLWRAVGVGVTALGALIAVGVAVLFLALTGASRRTSAARNQSSGYVPLIRYHGTGGTPAAAGIHTRPIPGAEHSEGAVP
jgi:hypothetical protein